jgi:transcriptional regulator with XRE-family HTH domain
MRAARALIRWDQKTLATEAGISVETIKRLEKMDGTLLAVTGTTLTAIRTALEAAGVIFIASNGDGPGVRLKR